MPRIHIIVLCAIKMINIKLTTYNWNGLELDHGSYERAAGIVGDVENERLIMRTIKLISTGSIVKTIINIYLIVVIPFDRPAIVLEGGRTRLSNILICGKKCPVYL